MVWRERHSKPSKASLSYTARKMACLERVREYTRTQHDPSQNSTLDRLRWPLQSCWLILAVQELLILRTEEHKQDSTSQSLPTWALRTCCAQWMHACPTHLFTKRPYALLAHCFAGGLLGPCLLSPCCFLQSCVCPSEASYKLQ